MDGQRSPRGLGSSNRRKERRSKLFGPAMLGGLKEDKDLAVLVQACQKCLGLYGPQAHCFSAPACSCLVPTPFPPVKVTTLEVKYPKGPR